jgi:hypothetical protein
VRTCPDTVTGQVLEGDRFRKGRWRFNVHGRPLGAHVKQHSSAVSPFITHSHISHFAGFSEAMVLDERRLHLPLLHAPATLEQPAFSAFCRNISCSPRVLGRKHATSRRVTKWGFLPAVSLHPGVHCSNGEKEAAETRATERQPHPAPARVCCLLHPRRKPWSGQETCPRKYKASKTDSDRLWNSVCICRNGMVQESSQTEIPAN